MPGIKWHRDIDCAAERFICAIQLLKIEIRTSRLLFSMAARSVVAAHFSPHRGLVRTARKVNARECQ